MVMPLGQLLESIPPTHCDIAAMVALATSLVSHAEGEVKIDFKIQNKLIYNRDVAFIQQTNQPTNQPNNQIIGTFKVYFKIKFKME
jgi:hypothetical protein